MTIRSFIAIPLSNETSNELGDVAGKMSYQDKSSAVKWVDQGNYHITLAFLGDQQQTDLETLAEQLDDYLQQQAFLLKLTHPQPFPETRPKLLAAMADRCDDILSLQQQVASAVKSTNLIIDKRKFVPHVTLGRYRHTRNRYAGKIPINISFETYVEEVVLYESVLTSSGAEYEPIYRFPLDEFYEDEL